MTGPRRRACCALAALAALGLLGWAAFAYKACLSPAPLQFPPFAFAPLERAALTAKLELRELPSRLTGGPVEVRLGERDWNGILFGDANQTEHRKARVRIEGDTLRFEVVMARGPSGGPPGPGEQPVDYVNVQALVSLTMGPTPEDVNLVVIEGQVGSYTLGPLTRPLAQRFLRDQLVEARARAPRLQQIHALFVREDHVHVVYPAP